MSICQSNVALYFVALYMRSTLIASTKSQFVRTRPNYSNVTDILLCDTIYS